MSGLSLTEVFFARRAGKADLRTLDNQPDLHSEEQAKTGGKIKQTSPKSI
jgi:hypothetical protein